MSGRQPVVVQSSGPNLLIRVIYFLLIGWWLGGIVSGVAWFLNVTIIGLPVGLYLINRLPTLITLRPQEQRWIVDEGILRRGQEQYSFLVRAVYFLLIGWWLSGVWMAVAYACLVSIVLIPVSFWMYGRIGAVTTLFRS